MQEKSKNTDDPKIIKEKVPPKKFFRYFEKERSTKEDKLLKKLHELLYRLEGRE